MQFLEALFNMGGFKSKKRSLAKKRSKQQRKQRKRGLDLINMYSNNPIRNDQQENREYSVNRRQEMAFKYPQSPNNSHYNQRTVYPQRAKSFNQQNFLNKNREHMYQNKFPVSKIQDHPQQSMEQKFQQPVNNVHKNIQDVLNNTRGLTARYGNLQQKFPVSPERSTDQKVKMKFPKNMTVRVRDLNIDNKFPVTRRNKPQHDTSQRLNQKIEQILKQNEYKQLRMNSQDVHIKFPAQQENIQPTMNNDQFVRQNLYQSRLTQRIKDHHTSMINSKFPCSPNREISHKVESHPQKQKSQVRVTPHYPNEYLVPKMSQKQNKFPVSSSMREPVHYKPAPQSPYQQPRQLDKAKFPFSLNKHFNLQNMSNAEKFPVSPPKQKQLTPFKPHRSETIDFVRKQTQFNQKQQQNNKKKFLKQYQQQQLFTFTPRVTHYQKFQGDPRKTIQSKFPCSPKQIKVLKPESPQTPLQNLIEKVTYPMHPSKQLPRQANSEYYSKKVTQIKCRKSDMQNQIKKFPAINALHPNQLVQQLQQYDFQMQKKFPVSPERVKPKVKTPIKVNLQNHNPKTIQTNIDKWSRINFQNRINKQIKRKVMFNKKKQQGINFTFTPKPSLPVQHEQKAPKTPLIVQGIPIVHISPSPIRLVPQVRFSPFVPSIIPSNPIKPIRFSPVNMEKYKRSKSTNILIRDQQRQSQIPVRATTKAPMTRGHSPAIGQRKTAFPLQRPSPMRFHHPPQFHPSMTMESRRMPMWQNNQAGSFCILQNQQQTAAQRMNKIMENLYLSRKNTKPQKINRNFFNFNNVLSKAHPRLITPKLIQSFKPTPQKSVKQEEPVNYPNRSFVNPRPTYNKITPRPSQQYRPRSPAPIFKPKILTKIHLPYTEKYMRGQKIRSSNKYFIILFVAVKHLQVKPFQLLLVKKVEPVKYLQGKETLEQKTNKVLNTVDKVLATKSVKQCIIQKKIDVSIDLNEIQQPKPKLTVGSDQSNVSIINPSTLIGKDYFENLTDQIYNDCVKPHAKDITNVKLSTSQTEIKLNDDVSKNEEEYLQELTDLINKYAN